VAMKIMMRKAIHLQVSHLLDKPSFRFSTTTMYV
jgi:hypothetical protein